MGSSSISILAIALLLMTLLGQSTAQLTTGFYNGRCRNTNVEQVVAGVVTRAFQSNPRTTAFLLRMMFHDSFSGCDASLILDGGEKNAGNNANVRGYEIIENAKVALEARCPGVVSCADIMVIATRTAVNLAGGRFFNVQTGRRDSPVSRPGDANNLPTATTPVQVATSLFRARGMSNTDFVLLLGGGHTVGRIRCLFFLDRLYNFGNSGRPDSTMNSVTLANLRRQCPRSGSNNDVFADQTPGSGNRFDRSYFSGIRQGRGVLLIDQRIASHSQTSAIVRRLSTSTTAFNTEFGGAFNRLARNRVLTGTQGVIRRSCIRG